MAKSRKDFGDVDAAFEALGPLKRYNIVQFFIQTPVMWIVAYQSYSVVFEGRSNPFRCPGLDESEVLNYSLWHANQTFNPEFDNSCLQQVRNSSVVSNPRHCTDENVIFSLPEDISFESEFKVVCDRSFLKAMAQSLYFAGYGIGGFVVPFFSDRFGRKKTLMVIIALNAAMATALAFSVNIEMYIAIKFFLGFVTYGMEGVSTNILMESLVTRNRSFMFAFVLSVSWSLGMSSLPVIAFFLSDFSWRVLQYTLAAVYGYIFVLLLLMDETLRWLSANGRTKEALAVISRASRWNGCDKDEVLKAFLKKPQSIDHVEKVGDRKYSFELIVPEGEDEFIKSAEVEKGLDNPIFTISNEVVSGVIEKARQSVSSRRSRKQSEIDAERLQEHLTFKTLLTDPTMRKHAMFGFLAFFCNNVAYSGLNLMSFSIAGSLYVNFAINSLVEIPQAIFLMFYLERIGRKKFITLFALVGGISLIVMATLRKVAPEEEIVIAVLSFVGKLGVSGSFNICWTYIPELFPTNLRNSGQGFSSVGMAIGGILAPFMETLYQQVVYAPGVIFGACLILLSGATFFMPETTKYQLPQTLAEIKRWGKEEKINNQKA